MARSVALDPTEGERRDRAKIALFAKGFRPFFLLGAAFAALFVPLWVLVFADVARAGGYLAPSYWHAHEMIYGFAAAIIAGFLLTAVANWTKRETAVGAPLAALCLWWLLGRVVMSAPELVPRPVPLLVDGTFLPALAVVLARPLIAAGSRRNYVMLVVLAALSAVNVLMHLDALGVVTGFQRRGSFVAVDIVVVLMLVIAGRVVPMFTRNATGVASIRSWTWLDRFAIGAMALLAVLDAVAADLVAVPFVALAAGVLAAARAVPWGARYSAREPLLWILHVGYAWIPIGLILRGVSAFTRAVPVSGAVHALTVGAIGSLTIGMMARVALGHTGRPLKSPPLATAAFVLMTLAALARVVVPIAAPPAYFASVATAGGLWAAAFALYVAGYARVLASPRADGKAG